MHLASCLDRMHYSRGLRSSVQAMPSSKAAGVPRTVIKGGLRALRLTAISSSYYMIVSEQQKQKKRQRMLSSRRSFSSFCRNDDDAEDYTYHQCSTRFTTADSLQTSWPVVGFYLDIYDADTLIQSDLHG